MGVREQRPLLGTPEASAKALTPLEGKTGACQTKSYLPGLERTQEKRTLDPEGEKRMGQSWKRGRSWT